MIALAFAGVAAVSMAAGYWLYHSGQTTHENICYQMFCQIVETGQTLTISHANETVCITVNGERFIAGSLDIAIAQAAHHLELVQ